MRQFAENILTRLKRQPAADRLRRFLNRSAIYSEEHWCRVVMNRETLKLVYSLDISSMDALEVSGTRWSAAPFRSYRSVSYPEFDLCSPPTGISADMILAEQVFEHLLWPYRAGRAAYDLLRPHGYLFVTTPFLIKMHDAPIDCSRWSETGIRHFLAECGFPLENIRTASWGNEECVRSNLKTWTRYKKWIHSLENETEFPMVVWALAQK